MGAGRILPEGGDLLYYTIANQFQNELGGYL